MACSSVSQVSNPNKTGSELESATSVIPETDRPIDVLIVGRLATNDRAETKDCGIVATLCHLLCGQWYFKASRNPHHIDVLVGDARAGERISGSAQ